MKKQKAIDTGQLNSRSQSLRFVITIKYNFTSRLPRNTYNRFMKILNKPFVLYDNIPSRRPSPYKDRHIPIHIRNLVIVKKNKKNEIRKIETEILQKRVAQHIKYKKIETATNNHFKLLNII